MVTVAVLGCSSRSNGELTMALEWARRLTVPHTIHAVVGPGSVKTAFASGAQVHPYPHVGGQLARARILELMWRIRPDVLVLADLALFHISPELGTGLLRLLPALLNIPRVLALDLYDWDRCAAELDTFGARLHKDFHRVPPSVGRLLPCPMHVPRPSGNGRFYHAMWEDRGPLSTSVRRDTRARLGLGSGPVMLWTTSSWQHPVAGRMSMSPHRGTIPQAEQGERVMLQFPAYALRLLNAVAQQVPDLTLVHVGPEAWVVPPDVTTLRYRHLSALPPDDFVHLLGTTDLLFNPNTPASSAVRASTLRVPVLSVHQSQVSLENHPLLNAYLKDVSPTYAWSIWPGGLHHTVHTLLRDNPFANAQAHVDVMQPDALIARAAQLLTQTSAADELRHAQDRLWQRVTSEVGHPDDAVTAPAW